MADSKLSELTELAVAPATDDEIYIRDISEAAAAESKRITIANLLSQLPAVTLGGTVTVNGQIFDAGAGDAEVDTTGGGAGLLVKSTQDGATGARVALKQISANPANNDYCYISAIMRDSNGEDTEYARILLGIQDVTHTTEAGRLDFYLMNGAGSLVQAMYLLSGGTLGLVTGVLTPKVQDGSGNQVVGARQVDARINDIPNSGDATTDGIIAALQACVQTHGLMTAA